MRVVSNTSPLSSLARIGRLNLLREILGNVILPQAVFEELEALDDADAREALRSGFTQGWLSVENVTNLPLVVELNRRLDPGESEAIALAANAPEPTLLLIDERDGRLAASGLGLKITGALGILIRAKNEGRVPSLGLELAKLRSIAHFFIEPALEERLLGEVGET